MMVIDSSAILAILQDEPERRAFNEAIEMASERRLSAASLVELSIVPFDSDQALIARSAFHRFGKGRHPAGLNLGDCFSYALSRACDAPLLFKGQDFRHTDLIAATDILSTTDASYDF